MESRTKYGSGGEKLEYWMGDFLNRVRMGEEWPDRWKEGMPIRSCAY